MLPCQKEGLEVSLVDRTATAVGGLPYASVLHRLPDRFRDNLRSFAIGVDTIASITHRIRKQALLHRKQRHGIGKMATQAPVALGLCRLTHFARQRQGVVQDMVGLAADNPAPRDLRIEEVHNVLNSLVRCLGDQVACLVDGEFDDRLAVGVMQDLDSPLQ